MTVIALVTDEAVSHTAWRITRPFNMLRLLKYSADVLSFPDNPTADGLRFSPVLAQHIITALQKISCEIVVLPRVTVYKNLRDEFLYWMAQLHQLDITVIYEIDDDIFSEAWPDHWAKCFELDEEKDDDKFRQMRKQVDNIRDEAIDNRWILDQVDGITVATERLKLIINQYTNKPVVVVENKIDVAAFNEGLAKSPKWEGKLTIGWAAGYRHELDSENVAKAWAIIAKKYPIVEFVIAGHVPQNLGMSVPQYRLQTLPFKSMATYPSSMQVDIGCCSVADTDFNKSRGPGKAMEFGLAGAAVVATPLVYESVIHRKDFGLLANTTKEWVDALSTMIDSREYREITQRNLKKKIQIDHSLHKNVGNWPNAWKSLVALSTRTIPI